MNRSPQEQATLLNSLCPCCGVDPNFTPYSLSCDNMELADMGSGYVLYFKLVIFIGCLSILFCLINVIKAISNISKGFCSNTQQVYNYLGHVCVRDWVTVHSVVNYNMFEEDSTEKAWMLVFWIFYTLGLSVCKIYLKRTNKSVDIMNDTPGDWTLMIKGMPVSEPEEVIKKNFEAFGAPEAKKITCYVKKINRAYNLDEYLKQEKTVNKLKTELKKIRDEELQEAVRSRLQKEAEAAKKQAAEKKKQGTCGSARNRGLPGPRLPRSGAQTAAGRLLREVQAKERAAEERDPRSSLASRS
jgi:lipid-A-disaccharide synthase-like uncharacterized protein